MSNKEKSETTEEKIARLEQLITEQKAEIFKLRNIIDNHPGDVYWKDVNGIWSDVNLHGAETLKTMGFIKTKEDVLGKSDYQLFTKETADAFKKNDQEVIEKKCEITSEETNTLPNGEKIIQLSTKRPLWDEKGNVVGIVGNTIDISHLKKIEADLQRAKIKAESANQAKSDFIANMSHDIRTPLSGIVGMSKLLEENALSDKERQFARWVNESGNQLLDLLNGVLDVISADNFHEGDLHPECFDLYKTIENIGRLELPAMKLKHIEFKVAIDTKTPRYVISDKTKFHRILLNLLGNAIKFTEKGYVMIQVKFLGKQNDEALLEISVEDTGIGIPNDVQKNIFDRFFRVNPSYKGVYSGHGLGLHIAQQYVYLLKGDIQLESHVGKGTRFYFTLPLKIGNPDTVTNEFTEMRQQEAKDGSILSETVLQINKSREPGSENPHILLIEDNAIALRLLETMCTQYHCDYTSAQDGETALRLAKSNSFDLIISDFGLPGISGIELTQAIREDEKNHNKPYVPIIGLTAQALTEATKPGLRAGMDKVLQKPIQSNTMQQLIERYVNLYSPSTSTNSTTSKPTTGLGLDLPDTEDQLFELKDYLLLDIEQGISTMGSIEALKGLLKDMLELLRVEELALNKAYAEKDWTRIEKLAHKIKGGAVYCGTVKVKYACQYIERYHRAGHRKSLDQLFQQLIQIINDTKISISNWLELQEKTYSSLN